MRLHRQTPRKRGTQALETLPEKRRTISAFHWEPDNDQFLRTSLLRLFPRPKKESIFFLVSGQCKLKPSATKTLPTVATQGRRQATGL
jgi:hypothetical protein